MRLYMLSFIAVLELACRKEQGGTGSGPPPEPPKGYVRIEPGTFTMGAPRSETEANYPKVILDVGLRGEAQHQVTISRPYWLKATEVTQGEWRALMGTNPSEFSKCGDKCPVEQVSWEDAIGYVNKLSEREGLSPCYGNDGSFKGLSCTGYRLPTEAEWEYAARAGTTAATYGPLNDVAWYRENSDGKTHPAGEKSPNAWGLYDMLGNVWEWVHDWYGDYAGPATDPVGPATGGDRVVRGGSWGDNAGFVRAAVRSWSSPGGRDGYLGFRPARSIP